MTTTDPLFWVRGAHGGSGASTLTQLLGPASECGPAWPQGEMDSSSPFVLIVARATTHGLLAAQQLALSHQEDSGGSVLLGLAMCAAAPRIDPDVRRFSEVVAEAFPNLWKIGWHSIWQSQHIEDLPVWMPGDPPQHGRRIDHSRPPAEIAVMGDDICELIADALTATYGPLTTDIYTN